MKTLSLIITLFFAITLSNAQDEQGKDITVTVANASNDNGVLKFSLHTIDTFMKGPGIVTVDSKIENGETVATFNNVSPGTYFIMVIHDENENGTMDFGADGRPTEAYGMSNNPPKFGPPLFDQGKFDLSTEGIEMSIQL